MVIQYGSWMFLGILGWNLRFNISMLLLSQTCVLSGHVVSQMLRLLFVDFFSGDTHESQFIARIDLVHVHVADLQVHLSVWVVSRDSIVIRDSCIGETLQHVLPDLLITDTMNILLLLLMMMTMMRLFVYGLLMMFFGIAALLSGIFKVGRVEILVPDIRRVHAGTTCNMMISLGRVLGQEW